MSVSGPRGASALSAMMVVAALAGGATAQETPRAGGELVFVVPAEPLDTVWLSE